MDTMTKRALAVILAALCSPLPAMAAPFTYTSEKCDFAVTFPDKPFIEEKCAKGVCNDVLTYTLTSEASSVDFRITCEAQDAKALAAVTPESLKTETDRMVKDAGLTVFTSDAAIVDKTKTAVSLATGSRNGRDIIFTGQIWAGAGSSLILEGEMAGPEDEKINTVFADVLRSVRDKNAPPESKVESKPESKAIGKAPAAPKAKAQKP
jgi:hypothetical protein